MDSNNSTVQILNSEKAVSAIISRFSTDFILDVIEDSIKMKFRPFNVGSANLVAVVDQEMKIGLLQNPSYEDKMKSVAEETYREIIFSICKSYNLAVSEDILSYSYNQIFGLAYTLYDIFITNFTSRMINFFVQYIVDNKEDIYNSIVNADEIRKNKDSVSYGKKLYVDNKLIVIHSDLNNVLNSITAHDIPFDVLLTYLSDRETAQYITSIIQDKGDIYKYHYASYIIDSTTRPDLFTAIKFEMQNRASDKPINFQQYAV